MTKRRKINLLIKMLKDGICLYRACKYLKLDRNLKGISQDLRNEIFALSSTQSVYYVTRNFKGVDGEVVYFEDIYSEVAKKMLQLY